MSKKNVPSDRNTIKRQLENLYRENGSARRETGQGIAGEDGVTHINIAMSGRTELGVLLGFDFRAPFKLRGLGTFLTLEGFCHYTQMQDDCPVFRRLDMYESRRMADNFKKRDHVANYNVIILDAMYQRIKQFSELHAMVKESVLPFDMYVERDGVRTRLAMARWVLEGLEYIREVIKSDMEPNFWHFLRHNRRDWDSALNGGNTIAAQMGKRLDRKAQIQFVKHCIAQRFPEILNPDAKDAEPISIKAKVAKPRQQPRLLKKVEEKKPAKDNAVYVRRRLVPALSQAYAYLFVDKERFNKRSNLLAPNLVVESMAVGFSDAPKGVLANLYARVPLLKMMRANAQVTEVGFAKDFLKIKNKFTIPGMPLTRHSEPGVYTDANGRYDFDKNVLIVFRNSKEVDVFPLQLSVGSSSQTDPNVEVTIVAHGPEFEHRVNAEDIGLQPDTVVNNYSFVKLLQNVPKTQAYPGKDVAEDENVMLWQYTKDGENVESLEFHGVEVHGFGLFRTEAVRPALADKVIAAAQAAVPEVVVDPQAQPFPLDLQSTIQAGHDAAYAKLVEDRQEEPMATQQPTLEVPSSLLEHFKQEGLEYVPPSDAVPADERVKDEPPCTL